MRAKTMSTKHRSWVSDRMVFKMQASDITTINMLAGRCLYVCIDNQVKTKRARYELLQSQIKAADVANRFLARMVTQ